MRPSIQLPVELVNMPNACPTKTEGLFVNGGRPCEDVAVKIFAYNIFYRQLKGPLIMKFPKWVLRIRSKRQQASARLRYMLYRIALEVSDTPTIRSMCVQTGVANHSTVSLYISQGAFSNALAARFEEIFGPDIITADALTDPMSIVEK